MKILFVLKNGLTKAFRWLIDKQRPWPLITLVFVLICTFFIIFGLNVVNRQAEKYENDLKSEDSKIQKQITELQKQHEQLQSDLNYSKYLMYKINIESEMGQLANALEINKDKWLTNNITDYSFKIQELFGGQAISEGSHGRSYGAYKQRLTTIKIDDSTSVSILDNVSSNKTFTGGDTSYPNAYENKSPRSIPELYDIIRECFDNPDSGLKGPDGFLPLLAVAEFNSRYGYPESITIYVQIGDLEKYNRLYLVTYKISEFKILN